jgi:hypothetical protein
MTCTGTGSPRSAQPHEPRVVGSERRLEDRISVGTSASARGCPDPSVFRWPLDVEWELVERRRIRRSSFTVKT